ncbi:hypothetical protein Tco_0258981, partial [Tanacetum coccineum]
NGDDEHPNLECYLQESTSGFKEKAGKLSRESWKAFKPRCDGEERDFSLEARTP